MKKNIRIKKNKKIKVILAVLLFLLVGISYIYFSKHKMKEPIIIDDIVYYQLNSFYFTSNKLDTYAMYSMYFDQEALKYYARIKPDSSSNKDEIIIEISENIMEKVRAIILKYNLRDWDGLTIGAQDIIDGDSFSLSAEFANGVTIHASGYKNFPNNYQEVVSELDNLFMNLYNEKRGSLE